MKKLIFAILMVMSVVPAFSGEYMKVGDKLVITEDYQRCYQVRPGYSRKDNAPGVHYCGKSNNFHYEEGYEYTIFVDKYDPNAPEMTVIKTLARDNSFYYKRLRARRDSIAKARAAEGKSAPTTAKKKSGK